jgi:glycosyltransferase involved in cell wall biosynthesis
MLPHAFPKILFVNDFPPDSLAVADLVRQLLLGYPQEKIAWWHWRSPRSHRIAGAPVDSVHHFPLPERFLPNRRLAGMKCALMENFWVPRASRHLEQTIQIVKPDLIWVLLYGWPILVAQRARLKNGARLHVSLWDFPDTMAGARILGAARSRRFCDAIFQLVRSADSFDGISRPMLQEIAGQTGRADGLLVHSGFEPADLENLAAADETNSDGVIRLAYVGTIISENSFLKMLAALGKIRPQLPRPVQLEFFGGRGYANRPWFDARWMQEHGIFSDVELVAALRRCSWGIVVMDPEGEDLQYSRFSFPNKVGTYLSAGVPVLGFGHPQSCLGRMMGEHSFGRFTSATDAAALEKFLVEAFQISAPRQLFREDILRVAKTEFNAAEMRARLWQAWAG